MKQILLILDSSTNIPATMAIIEKLQSPSSKLTAVYIIDSGWKSILGDEWISNATTRNNFFHYIERNKHQEANKIINDLKLQAQAKNIVVNSLIKPGVPQKVVVSACMKHGPFDLVILPYPSGKFVEGVVNLNMKSLTHEIFCPILIGPP